MQVSSTNSLTWLQPAGAAANPSASAGPADGQDLLDASGAEGSSPSSLMASLQSPSQQFSAGSLSALISAQLDQGAAGTQTATDPTKAQPPSGPIRQHHRHGGGVAPDPGLAPSPTATVTADASASAATSDAETEMAELLTGM